MDHLRVDTTTHGSAVDSAEVPEVMPRAAALLFAPVDKRAFGAALGAATGLFLFLATAVVLLISPDNSYGLTLLSEYFAGYSVSWTGALIGLAWGIAVGFCAGWFVAFTRNLVLAISLFIIRTRAELAETRDFLDHI
ncbi:MAG TPA: hypothetical protein VM939_13555 [Gemmatimonadaceae bacterium]|nr:hypothetical protein [Gemmatimonadaceae bacterium]